jgi:hypothetical protein
VQQSNRHRHAALSGRGRRRTHALHAAGASRGVERRAAPGFFYCPACLPAALGRRLLVRALAADMGALAADLGALPRRCVRACLAWRVAAARYPGHSEQS